MADKIEKLIDLPVTGGKHVRFVGRLIGSGSNKLRRDGTERKRWIYVDIYRSSSSDGSSLFVAGTTLCGRNKEPTFSVEHAKSPSELLDRLVVPNKNGNGVFIHPAIATAYLSAGKEDGRFADLVVDRLEDEDGQAER